MTRFFGGTTLVHFNRINITIIDKKNKDELPMARKQRSRGQREVHQIQPTAFGAEELVPWIPGRTVQYYYRCPRWILKRS